MLALCLRAQGTRYAVAAKHVLVVLPKLRLRPLANAPEGVLGLLPFRGEMVPVLDAAVLLRHAAYEGTPGRFSERIIVMEIKDADGQERMIALLAEDVTDLVRSEQAEAGVSLPSARYLGEHLVDVDELPQLILPVEILSESLREIFLNARESHASEPLS